MFATLLLIRHVIDGGREATTLKPGATLADELMRLYPRGLGAFDLYLRDVRDENLLPTAEHSTHRVLEGERYILVLRPQGIIEGIIGYIIVSLLVSVAVSVIAKVLAPKAKQADSTRDTESNSPNNSLAGQTNLLRPGARVPEILGKMRCWPDLIVNAQETWIGRSQWLVEWFVLGVGNYLVQNERLGETALAGISGSTLRQYRPGTIVPAILCVKRSPLVDNLSLLTETPTTSAASVTFTAPATMSSQVYIPVSLGPYGTPARIGGTTNNNRLFDVRNVPAQTQLDPPFVYTMASGVQTETASNVSVQPLAQILFIQNAQLTWSTTGDGDIVIPAAMGWVPVANQVVRIAAAANYIGTVVYVADEGTQYRFRLNNFLGARILLPSGIPQPPLLVYEEDPGELLSAASLARADQMFTTWTDWQTAPFANPQQLLIDIGFPQGLVWYVKGERRSLTVQVQADFKQLSASSTQASRTFTYTASTQGALRYTERVVVSDLGLPSTGSPYIQTRLRRVTAWKPDDSDNQYLWDTRWQVYSAATDVPARNYGNVTLLKLTLSNTRAAASIGETSFNVVATRILPTWNGSSWLPAAATERWADALVARMKATDGANKTDGDIDLGSIYDIQRRLDAQDNGDQGRIAVTLDQQQDIDTELQSIASVARCQLYRIGPKLYVERDEGGKTAIALFSGRSKHPDAETVSINLAHDADPDAVIVPWWDRALDAWKQREFQFPEGITPINPLRIGPAQATWAQAWRRAIYEWNRLTLRRETIAVKATEEGALVHPGDVVNVADDVGNLSQTAGEIIEVEGATDLRLDQEVDLSVGTWTILLRSLDGRTTDLVAVTQTAPTEVRLARTPRFALKGRDDALGSMYALYQTERSVVLPWLVTSIEPEERYVTINGTNWTEAVFDGDRLALPGVPVSPFAAAVQFVQPQTIGALADEDLHTAEATE